MPGFLNTLEGGFGRDGELFWERVRIGSYLGEQVGNRAAAENIFDVLGGERVFSDHCLEIVILIGDGD